MKLSLSEIRQRAIRFGHDWKDETSERAEAQTFWNEFFAVFGIHRRSVASFERTVRNTAGAFDRIDVIWQGVLIGEHKSRGQDLSRAATQAFGYVQSLTRERRDAEVPRYIVVSDFGHIVLHDLESTDPLFESVRFPVEDLHQHVRLFDFLNGIQSRPADPEDPINIHAVARLGHLHDALGAGGYTGSQLERLLVRVLFCLFADDTGIFDPDTFKTLVEESREDGSDLGQRLDAFFRVLDQPEANRPAAMPDELKSLPYVNGQLFRERLDLAYFDTAMRTAMLAASGFQWAKISPAVFGSLFQSIMADEAGARRRRQLGEHYTSERDILKLVRSLFLDDLRAEFERVKGNRRRLLEFHDRLAAIKCLDPACGCGNFLVITYRELRRLEHEVIDSLFPDHALIDVNSFVRLNVDQMHGIEIEEWPARIAEVAMWLIDHQMNLEASQRFGKPLVRLPLTHSARIVHANALRTDWNTVLPAGECSYVMGNPPFVGKHLMTDEQSADFDAVCHDVPGAGVLDFVAAWYVLAARYVADFPATCAFVSTNSIVQGEQVAPLWTKLFAERIKIRFGHRTFRWESEARGAAHVHVVIIGFDRHDRPDKFIVEYDHVDGDRPTQIAVRNVSPYLIDGDDIPLPSRSRPISDVPAMIYGSKPVDDQQLILEPEHFDNFDNIPDLRPFIRPFVGSFEFINRIPRRCLWLVDAPPALLRRFPQVVERLEKVRRFRAASKKKATREKADEPSRFAEIRQSSSDFIIVPSVSSETRQFFPMGFASANIIVSNLAFMIPNATPYHFGVLSSTMHMAWVRQVCGRLKSDYRYSNKLVYNNYPWPTEATAAQKQAVEAAAQGVLDARAAYPDDTLADLYDPTAMPKPLRDAHRTLDRAVDKCYRPAAFDSDRQRVEYLFGQYQRLTDLFAPARPTRRRRSGR